LPLYSGKGGVVCIVGKWRPALFRKHAEQAYHAMPCDGIRVDGTTFCAKSRPIGKSILADGRVPQSDPGRSFLADRIQL